MSPIETACEKAGGPRKLQEALGLKNDMTVRQWIKRNSVPPVYVIPIEKMTGIPRYDLRPDIYPPEEYKIVK